MNDARRYVGSHEVAATRRPWWKWGQVRQLPASSDLGSGYVVLTHERPGRFGLNALLTFVVDDMAVARLVPQRSVRLPLAAGRHHAYVYCGAFSTTIEFTVPDGGSTTLAGRWHFVWFSRQGRATLVERPTAP